MEIANAYQTSRLLNEYPDHLTYQGNGDSYMTEYAADAEIGGAKATIYWHFKIARYGKEVEGAYSYDTLEEDYDWSLENAYRINFDPDLLTANQAACVATDLGSKVTVRAIRHAAGAGYIPGARKAGRDWLIPYEGLNHYLDNRPKRGPKIARK